MSDPKPTAESVKGTVFEEYASDEQLALPVEERYSLGNEEIYSIRALVADNTAKDAELAALRAALHKTIRWVEEYHQPDGARDCEECANVTEARRALKEAEP